MSDRSKPAPGATRKVRNDERGHSVWVDTIRTAEFELVSTQSLKTFLEAEQAGQREAIEHIAASGGDGFLARDAATGHFQIIDDTALQAILDQQAADGEKLAPRRTPARPATQPTGDAGDHELALVTTQALRKILGTTARQQPAREETFSKDDAGGFNPYNNG
ncbi:MAG TPA: hypothetical protein VFE85_09245 [Woeseiaceae bacterium]|nr:hypothetical protein [Woeseiaceae bacterium]